jgi:hypothetical protein
MIDYITTTKREYVDFLLYGQGSTLSCLQKSHSALRHGINAVFIHLVFFGFVFTRL